jgi:hypothetical protein
MSYQGYGQPPYGREFFIRMRPDETELTILQNRRLKATARRHILLRDSIRHKANILLSSSREATTSSHRHHRASTLLSSMDSTPLLRDNTLLLRASILPRKGSTPLRVATKLRMASSRHSSTARRRPVRRLVSMARHHRTRPRQANMARRPRHSRTDSLSRHMARPMAPLYSPRHPR